VLHNMPEITVGSLLSKVPLEQGKYIPVAVSLRVSRILNTRQSDRQKNSAARA